jgi:hypothetical protein
MILQATDTQEKANNLSSWAFILYHPLLFLECSRVHVIMSANKTNKFQKDLVQAVVLVSRNGFCARGYYRFCSG